jgi:predicted DNA-binding ribbon-helix-helix protein
MDDRTAPRGKRAAKTRHEFARYDRDLYSWAVEQAALLRAGRIAEADVLNIAEEIDDVGNEQYRRLQSALRVILLHLLKWDHQPTRRSRSWWSSITVQRNHVRRALDKNPGLKPQIGLAVTEAYQDARVQASAQTRIEYRRLPERCPYSFEQIMERPIDWPPAD